MEVWPGYVARLQEVCAREGIQCCDANTLQLAGWCFIDRVHLTDDGYGQVAQGLVKELLTPCEFSSGCASA